MQIEITKTRKARVFDPDVSLTLEYTIENGTPKITHMSKWGDIPAEYIIDVVQRIINEAKGGRLMDMVSQFALDEFRKLIKTTYTIGDLRALRSMYANDNTEYAKAKVKIIDEYLKGEEE